MTNDSAESQCRHALGDERFERFRQSVQDEPRLRAFDHAAIYQAITDAAHIQKAYASLNPTLCRDRDDAVKRIERGLKDLKGALRGSPWAACTDDLEREFRKLTVSNDGTIPVLRLDAKRLRWPAAAKGKAPGGRTPAVWRDKGLTLLRAIRDDKGHPLSKEDAEWLMRRAGLIATMTTDEP